MNFKKGIHADYNQCENCAACPKRGLIRVLALEVNIDGRPELIECGKESTAITTATNLVDLLLLFDLGASHSGHDCGYFRTQSF